MRGHRRVFWRGRHLPPSRASGKSYDPTAGGAAPGLPGIPRTSGWTLVELLIGLAIAGILLGLAMPHYRDWIAAYQLLNHAQHLAGSMNTARSEAVKRAFHVHLCKSPDRRQCANAGGWGHGFIVYVDVNHDGQIDTDEPVLRIDGPAPQGISIHANRPLDDYVSYTSMGSARLLNGALQMGTFTMCRSGLHAIDVVLANSGRVRIQKTGTICP